METGFDFFTLEKYTSSSYLKSIAESENHWVGMDTARERWGGGGGWRERATDGLFSDSFRLSVTQVFIIRLRVCRCVSLAAKILVWKSSKCHYFSILGSNTIIIFNYMFTNETPKLFCMRT
jgi:hypothetical protein